MRLVTVRRSDRPTKKLVAIFEPRRVVHFGARGYGDFTTYSRQGRAIARAKRAQYVARHGAAEAWTDPARPATLSRYILWEKPTVREAVAAFRRRFRV